MIVGLGLSIPYMWLASGESYLLFAAVAPMLLVFLAFVVSFWEDEPLSIKQKDSLLLGVVISVALPILLNWLSHPLRWFGAETASTFVFEYRFQGGVGALLFVFCLYGAFLKWNDIKQDRARRQKTI